MYTATSYGYGEDFVMTPIKCPPPKIVAVKRSLKSKLSKNKKKNKNNIMDDENDSDVKDDFINEEEEEQDEDENKDLIEFEKEDIQPLIDLSDNSKELSSDDTIKDMNERNSNTNSSTITMLLDLLEIGSIINGSNKTVCVSEREDVEGCAQDDDFASLPTSTLRKSSSSSLRSFPLEYPGACAHIDTGNTDKLSSIPSLPQPLTAIQPENPSIVKNSSDKLGKSEESGDNLAKKSGESALHIALAGIDQLSVDLSRIQRLKHDTEENLQQLRGEKSSSILASNKILAEETQSSSKDPSHSCSRVQEQQLVREEKDKEEEDEKKSANEHVTFLNRDGVTQFAQQRQEENHHHLKEVSSDSNNNYFECNQNSLNFLSPNTSQRKLPPKFYSSTNSLNRSDCFEASSRLKRLEERFKGFSYTKKLLRSSKAFSKSEEILSSYGKESEFSNVAADCSIDTLNSSPLLLLHNFPLATPSTFSANCLRQLIVSEGCEEVEKCEADKGDYHNISSSSSEKKYPRPSLNNNNAHSGVTPLESKNKNHKDNNCDTLLLDEGRQLPFLCSTNRIQSPESSSIESDEICKILRCVDGSDKNENNVQIENCGGVEVLEIVVNDKNNNCQKQKDQKVEDCEEEDCSFVYFEEEPGDRSVSICEEGSQHSVFNDITFSNCEFDVQTFNKFLNSSEEENKESTEEEEEEEEDDDEDTKSDESDFFCDCLVEAVPLYHQTSTTTTTTTSTAKNNMRETGASAGKLRGLLKPANRPPPARKNRVVFDETRNEFFDADYIILIREDCPYDEEDEEPCTCGDHELVRICCDEGCNCGYADVDDGRTPPSPKFAPPIEFVDQATLSPPEGYKDGSLLDTALSDALSNHVFGAQHIQQLQVIQRLQQQRAAMLAARAAASASSQQQPPQPQQQQPPLQQQQPPSQQQQQQQSVIIDPQQGEICPECTQCSECAAAKLAELEAGECDSQCSAEEAPSPLEIAPPPHVLTITGSLVPVQKSSPERRHQKEIVAGEERPKFLLPVVPPKTEENNAQAEEPDQPPPKPPKAVTLQPPALPEGRSSIYVSSQSVENMKNDMNATVIPKFNVNGTAQAITGILKGGKLRKTDSIQNDDTNNTTSDEETSSKRSVRFNEEAGDEDNKTEGSVTNDENGKPKAEGQLTDYVTHMSLKRHSSLFHNALRPNSAVRQLFPVQSALTHEALKAFEESKRGGNLLIASQTITSAGSGSSSSTSPTPITHSASDTETIKRTIERNALRRSLIKKKAQPKEPTSLEERIRQLTCDIDEPSDSDYGTGTSLSTSEMEIRRDSPAGEETPQPTKFDKSFSPSSSASSSSSCSTGSTYKKITDLFNKEKRHEKIPETDENPILIQDCRCGPDIGMGVQMQASSHSGHSHQPPPPPPRAETTKRQFLNTLAPLTACVAGQRDDNFSYYMANKPGDRTSTASSQTGDQYSIGDIDAALQDTESKKVAPDVLAGTPGQEQQDELASFAQQEANRMDRIKKRYSSESAPASGVNSDDDEQNDYGFNKRPSVRGIKPRFGSTNEILQQMQDQLSQPNVPVNASVVTSNAQATNNLGCSATLPRTNAAGQLQVSKQQQQQQQQQQTPANAHQHTWTYVPDQQGKQQQPPNANYYHLPAHARHSYHGHEAIYQNCHTMTVQQTQQAIIPGHVHQKLIQQPHAIHAIQHAQQQINRFSHFARSPTRRPESPPPLRNYHQTMVLIPYKSNANGTYTAYGIAGETSENIYEQRHNIVEYQQVTSQTIRVPLGYPLPHGMQLHVVRPSGVPNAAPPHYATLPRQNSSGGTPQATKFVYAEQRGAPEGEAAATVEQNDCANNMSMAACQGESGENNANNNPQGTVYYAMNV